MGPMLGPLWAFTGGSQVCKTNRPGAICRALFRAMEGAPKKVLLTVIGAPPGAQILTARGSERQRLRIIFSPYPAPGPGAQAKQRPVLLATSTSVWALSDHMLGCSDKLDSVSTKPGQVERNLVWVRPLWASLTTCDLGVRPNIVGGGLCLPLPVRSSGMPTAGACSMLQSSRSA